MRRHGEGIKTGLKSIVKVEEIIKQIPNIGITSSCYTGGAIYMPITHPELNNKMR